MEDPGSPKATVYIAHGPNIINDFRTKINPEEPIEQNSKLIGGNHLTNAAYHFGKKNNVSVTPTYVVVIYGFDSPHWHWRYYVSDALGPTLDPQEVSKKVTTEDLEVILSRKTIGDRRIRERIIVAESDLVSLLKKQLEGMGYNPVDFTEPQTKTQESQ